MSKFLILLNRHFDILYIQLMPTINKNHIQTGKQYQHQKTIINCEENWQLAFKIISVQRII